MTGQLVDFAVERRCRRLDKGIAAAEIAIASLQADLKTTHRRALDLSIEPRAREMLKFLEGYFQGDAAVVAEIDHLRELLMDSRKPEGQS